MAYVIAEPSSFATFLVASEHRAIHRFADWVCEYH